MNKHLPFILLLPLLFIESTIAQDLKELTISGNAKKLDSELVARRDQNGNYCAAIQVISDMDGFTYDSNDGIVGKVDNNPGMDMVYLTSSERVLKVFKSGYKPLQIILSEYGITLNQRQVWQITIAGEEHSETIPVTLRFEPSDAEIFIDGISVSGNTHNLTRGQHNIKIVKQGYEPSEETITIDEKHVFFEWKLRIQLDNGLLIKEDSLTIDMVFVKGGSFIMGCTSAHSDCEDDEKYTHEVTLNDFYIGKHEVTQQQWYEIMGKNPSHFNGCDSCPVEKVSWYNVKNFIRKLNKKTGKSFTLPTEAQWEYASRGGIYSKEYKYAGSNNLNSVGWYWQNSGENELHDDWNKNDIKNNQCKPHPVGQKKPNELGIFDMSGNVWEWCNDRYDGEFYKKSQSNNPKGPGSGDKIVNRGGGWSDEAEQCRITNRGNWSTSGRRHDTGFRLVINSK